MADGGLVMQPFYGANAGGPVDMYAPTIQGRGIPGMQRADKPAPAYTGWQNSYTYDSPLGGTYQSPWSPEYVASLNPSAGRTTMGASGLSTPYGSIGAPSGYQSYGIPSFSQFTGTDLNSLLNNMANLKLKVQAPTLAEQSREYDLQHQLATLQANQAYNLGQGQIGLGQTQAANALTLGQGQIANQAAQIANDLQIQLGVNANTAQQIANAFALGNTQAANALTLGLGQNANAAQQILNNYTLGSRAQTLSEQQYQDAAARQQALQNWLFKLSGSPGVNTTMAGNAAVSALAGGYHP